MKNFIFATALVVAVTGCGGGTSSSGVEKGALPVPAKAGYYEGVYTGCVGPVCVQGYTSLLVHGDGRVVVDAHDPLAIPGEMIAQDAFIAKAGPRQMSFICEANGFGPGHGFLDIQGTFVGAQVSETLTGHINCPGVSMSAPISGSATLVKAVSLSKAKGEGEGVTNILGRAAAPQ